MHLAIAMDGIDLAIVIEENAEIVDAASHIVVLPRTCYLLACIALQALAIDIRENVELSVGIADGRSPDALSINLLMILQREGIIIEVKAVEAIRYVFPVHKVARMKNHQSWHSVHGGACKVIIVTYSKDVWIGKLIIEQRVGKRAIPIVGCP